MVNRATSLLIVSWAFIAVADRLERDSGSVVATAAVGLQNLTVVVGTHGIDRGEFSRVDLAIPTEIALAVAVAAYLSTNMIGSLESIQASFAPWKISANDTLQDLFTPVPSDQGVTDNLFGQTVEELLATNHELQKDAEDLTSLMVDTLSSVEAPEDKLVTLADKLMKVGKMIVQHCHPSWIYEDIAPNASQSKTPLQMAGRRVVDNMLKSLFSGTVHETQWKSNMRRLEKVLGFEGDDEGGFDEETWFDVFKRLGFSRRVYWASLQGSLL